MVRLKVIGEKDDGVLVEVVDDDDDGEAFKGGEIKDEWVCGKCGKKVSLLKLPWKDGKPQCDCGYIFGKDNWHIDDYVQISKEIKARVSTVFLELEHSGMLYETMTFLESNSSGMNLNTTVEGGSGRYKTKDEAIEGHKKIYRKLLLGQYEYNGLLDKKGRELTKGNLVIE